MKAPRVPVARPETRQFERDLLQGLSQRRKRLPCKYLYNARGSWLFERICELDEYYPTRTEAAILAAHAEEIAELFGPEAQLVEFGSGSSSKTRLLLDAARDLASYVPLDISRAALEDSAVRLRACYPGLEVLPVHGDYTGEVAIPAAAREARRRVVFFPGSTIGNFEPPCAVRLLWRMARVCGTGGAVLLGADLKKDPAVLERAYDDARGVTAEFNLNLLRRANAELGAGFRVQRFAHRARYDRELGRIEMHLESLEDQQVTVGGRTVRFAAGETIHTENSYKYDLDELAVLAARAGLRRTRIWTDPGRLFSVQYLEVG